MSGQGECFALFETRIGTCAVAWGPHGVTAIRLPALNVSDTREAIAAARPAAVETSPDAPMAMAIDAMKTLISGTASQLDSIALDMTGVPPFHRRVYEAARQIAPGSVLTYGDVARRLGQPGAARAVGQALGRNPFPIVVPCHRVVAANGRIGGFTAPGGVSTKQRLLAIEGGMGKPA
jgi:methylated-DNA-[protein]-cysteine S-methyltransferase